MSHWTVVSLGVQNVLQLLARLRGEVEEFPHSRQETVSVTCEVLGPEEEKLIAWNCLQPLGHVDVVKTYPQSHTSTHVISDGLLPVESSVGAHL